MTGLEQLNRAYWKKVIEMAKASGMAEDEWCRQNSVPINVYYRYEKVLENDNSEYSLATDDCGDSGSNGSRTARHNSPRPDSEYVEIPIGRKTQTTPAPQSEQTPNMKPVQPESSDQKPELMLKIGSSSLSIFPGAGEATLSTILKAVMGNA